YMSPEQARGEPVDKRADVWAFGVVLWEMLTGKRLFHGKTVPDTLAAVIRDEPDIGKAPAKVRPLLRRCLEKDPQRRLRDIGDAMGMIEDAPEEAAKTARHWTPWAAAVALLIPLGAVSFIHFREQPPPTPAPVRFQIPAPNDKAPLSPVIAVSPDGRKLAFLYQDKLWVHFLDTGESRGLTATTGGTPFWSPDSRFIGFTADGKVKKIEATGGPAQTVCDLGVNWGAGSWNQDDVILFGQVPGPIFKVPAAGGVPVPVTKVDPSRQERTHIEPWFLPDGRHFLYVRRGAQIGYTSYIGSLDVKPEDQSTKPLLTGDGQLVYAPSADPRTGYLLFAREGTLMAQPFDNEKRELTGQPVALAEQVFNDGGWEAFSVSANGVLVFQHDGSARNSQLTWFDEQGKPMGTVGDPARYSDVGLSPDGMQAATVREGANNEDIWLLELARGTSIRFTSDPVLKGNPVWSPDSSRIVFRQRGSGLVLKPSNGPGAQEVLLKSVIDVYPTSWSHDGRFLLYSLTDPKTRSDIWVLPMDGDRKPAVLLNTEFNEGSAAFSPDGRWISYNSDESGKPEVYVRPFEPPSGKAPAVGAQRVISTGGGRGSAWRADGKELYYGSLDGKTMTVEIATSPVFRAGTPHAAEFPSPKGAVAGDRTTDGKRFLIAIQVGEDSPKPYSVVLNWPSLLKKN
ncbi:MAG TPA: protein kinase, partial [Bryobacteraceae bacterium]|nr:protein kinase [Bryobacteraceae bacterium]